jgi:serine kinase of HPr protein (carbohydrate metabolism regulator)
MAADVPTLHAAAVLIGPKAVLIRGASGSGKSLLAWQLLHSAPPQGALGFIRLVGDDRVHVEARSGRLLVRAVPALAGLLEVRGLGIRRRDYEPLAVVGLIVDLGAADGERLPQPDANQAKIEGITLPRLAVAPGANALQMTHAFLGTAAGAG